MPTTYWTFLAATLAIAGIPIFAGFFSKDEILARTFAAGATDLNGFGNVYQLLWLLAVGGALLTAFYMFRAVYLTFHGAFRGEHETEHHLHESPPSMTVPLIILGVLSVIGGFVGFPGQLFHKSGWNLIETFLHPVVPPLGHATHGAPDAEHAVHALSLGTEWFLVILSVAVAGAGWLIARRFYVGDSTFATPQTLAERLPYLHKLLFNKYWVDEIYGFLIITPVHRGAVFLWRVFDELIIDTLVVNGAAFTVELTGDVLRFFQTGNVRNYALAVAAAVLALAAALW
jgi:NADH-quinone oxidoreductase subunit L